jgi:hypothetical protein
MQAASQNTVKQRANSAENAASGSLPLSLRAAEGSVAIPFNKLPLLLVS